jgi:ribosome maturation factor RimP
LVEVEAMVRPVVESAGLELVDVAFHREQGRRILRVLVDRDPVEGGLDLETIAEVSGRISRRLDLEGFDPPGGRYELEVSSPGVERPLKQPLDFAKRVGEKVKVKTVEPVEGARTFVGTISEASPTQVTIVTEEGERRIAFDNVSSARTVFEWARGGSR